MTQELLIKCPTCKKELNFYASEFRPFCSERCKTIDLGNWAQEKFAVPAEEQLRDEDLTDRDLIETSIARKKES